MTFTDLGVCAPILKALEEKGYNSPTPIQEQAIPIVLKRKDLLGCAQTGTGKTAAFSIPLIQHLYNENKQSKGKRQIRALIVTPTRELALQIDENFTEYGKYTGIRNMVIFGGVKQHNQVEQLKRGTDVLIATPGRLLDLINQGFIALKHVEYCVLDEADRMLDMGFIHDIKKIIALLPAKRQSLFFSATMPPDIVALSQKILGTPEKVTIKPQQTTAEKVEQGLYFIGKKSKGKLLVHLLETEPIESVIVFSRTKHGANRIVKELTKADVKAEAIHGNKSQGARQRALSNFKDGSIKVLVATDIAARGIDVSELSHVINYDLPNIPETYVHRIGRTGRANASGIALSFCNMEERAYLKDIEKLIQQKIPVIADHPYSNEPDEIEELETDSSSTPQQRRRRSVPSHKQRNKDGKSSGNRASGQRSRTAKPASDARPKRRSKKNDR